MSPWSLLLTSCGRDLKKWLHIAYYCLLKIYNFNSYALSGFCDGNISFIIFTGKWPKLRLKASFYSVIISFRELCRVLKCLLDAAKIFPISVIAFEKMRKKVIFLGKRIQLTFSRLFATHCQYTIAQKHTHFLLYLIDSIHLLRKPHIFRVI